MDSKELNQLMLDVIPKITKNLKKKLVGKKELIQEVLLYLKMYLCHFCNLRLKLMILL